MEWVKGLKGLLVLAWKGYRAYNGDPQAAKEVLEVLRARAGS